ncbi:MAG: hypothetical protein Q8R76_01815 [Candidatus Omnitrophota bacterium]|nr:hypothetical protein [Candidatus Omnitrophota bacterium]
MNPDRKLKRGLKDISPAFSEPTKAIPSIVRRVTLDGPPGVTVLSIFSPDYPADSFLLNTLLASRLANAQRPGHIISIDAEWDARQAGKEKRIFSQELLNLHLRRSRFSWSQFSEICRRRVPETATVTVPDQLIFLDVHYGCVPFDEEIAPILDKWIFFLQPRADSLSEAYKMMKATFAHNPHLEYFLVFEGDSKRKPLGPYLFERFSSILSERLGVNLVWLGYLDPSGAPNASPGEITLEHLFLGERRAMDNPAKVALAGLTELSLGRYMSTAS